jgi:hypothetical protein
MKSGWMTSRSELYFPPAVLDLIHVFFDALRREVDPGHCVLISSVSSQSDRLEGARPVLRLPLGPLDSILYKYIACLSDSSQLQVGIVTGHATI